MSEQFSEKSKEQLFEEAEELLQDAYDGDLAEFERVMDEIKNSHTWNDYETLRRNHAIVMEFIEQKKAEQK